MKKIGELLVEQGKISERDVERALLGQAEMGGKFGEVLVKLGLVSDVDVAAVLSRQLNIALQPSSGYPESPLYIEGVATEFLVSNSVVPVAVSGTGIRFSATVPQDSFLEKALALAIDEPISLCLGLETDIAKALQLYAQHLVEEETEDGDRFGGQSDDEFIEHLKDLASEAPVIRLVNQIIHRAVDLGASDIHIEPFEESLQLRYRVDGVLQDFADSPPR